MILKNLIDNARKYTEHGRIALTAAAAAGGVELSVTDTGYGIPAEDLSRIFEPFRQISGGRPPNGVGLGAFPRSPPGRGARRQGRGRQPHRRGQHLPGLAAAALDPALSGVPRGRRLRPPGGGLQTDQLGRHRRPAGHSPGPGGDVRQLRRRHRAERAGEGHGEEVADVGDGEVAAQILAARQPAHPAPRTAPRSPPAPARPASRRAAPAPACRRPRRSTPTRAEEDLIGSHFKRALELYLEDLARQQPVECLKLLGDVNLVNLEKPAEAAAWYRTGVDLAKLWGLAEQIPPMAANLARAAYLTNDLAAGLAAAKEAITGTERHPEGRQVRIVALNTLRTINQALHDNKGATTAARAMYDDLCAGRDWATLCVFVDDLVDSAMRSGEYELANEMMTEALAHRPSAGQVTAAPMQADVPSLMVSGPTDETRHVRLWRLGGATAQLTRRFSDAQKRYATSVELAQRADDRDGLRAALAAWAGCLCELGAFEEARAMYARAIEGADSPAQRATTAIQGAEQFLMIAQQGVLFSETGNRVTQSEHSQARAARAAAELFEAAETDWNDAGLTEEKRRELSWSESHARALDAWMTRRAGEGLADAIERAQAAVRLAERIPNAVGALEALDVLYFSYRDSGSAQLAAQTLCRIADVFTKAAIAADADADVVRRWVENEASLPGVGLHPNRHGGSFLLPPPGEEFVVWSANAVRSPSLGMLALREHGATLSIAQLEALWKAEGLWMPRSMGSLRNLQRDAMSWQVGVLARGGSPSVAPERWVDRLASGYLLLAALSGARQPWLDAPGWAKWCQRGYQLVVGSLSLLGLTRAAFQHCPRPPSCEQPTSPASRLVPLTPDVADTPDLWNAAGQYALECGRAGAGGCDCRGRHRFRRRTG